MKSKGFEPKFHITNHITAVFGFSGQRVFIDAMILMASAFHFEKPASNPMIQSNSLINKMLNKH